MSLIQIHYRFELIGLSYGDPSQNLILQRATSFATKTLKGYLRKKCTETIIDNIPGCMKHHP